ncbi:class Ib ribonucleoside-diphosphate reductase assembly flavoprotein NrdI [Cryobacterium sp. SO2]|uniref:class Ib ribonucleoside-diphosphate reductase assembly flavoprotein NrdI n=1 Tax=Cryobacterium sp. SO2 TaxID=1897060 RepID=UPI00223DBCE9|nr:class Ib ribonucleoside-diphosphate reductase assembly flavoprotein NrdI [Cryobacterium sp. SO2]WEO77823.1 class Ib ribonucleoside-diphosphate reductase assembly flavoprotein NrdI [Cryobacterium sp. SO2]
MLLQADSTRESSGSAIATAPTETDAGTVDIIYFSSISGNTKRFVEKLGRPAARIPLYPKDAPLVARHPFVLVLPTYGGGNLGPAVPRQVIRFLNDERNRSLIRGVIGAGNTNFGEAFCLAGDIIAQKCGVPHLYRFEVFGTPDDVATVHEGLEEFWKQQP